MDFEAIKKAAEGYRADMTRFLRDLVAIPSESCGEEGVIRRIAAEMEKLGFDKVEVDGLGEGLRSTLSSRQLTVQLTGGYGFISSLNKDSVRLFVDCEGLEPGEHVLPVQIRIDNAPPFSCALSAPELTVQIKAE